MFGRTKQKVKRKAASEATRVVELDNFKAYVTRKQVKNINVRIKGPDGRVEVSAPSWVQDAEITTFLQMKSTWIRKKQLLVASSPLAQSKGEDPQVLAEMRAKVEECVPSLVSLWEPLMGVQAEAIVYRNMTSRWGSCNPKTGRICINIQLARYPDECLEYVVVHELCHLLERGHGDQFKEKMNRFMPDWKKRRALLR